MFEAIRDNPIAIREWRSLRRRASDWHIWVGIKWTLDPIVWGAPVVLTYALGPYGLWAMLACLRHLGLMPVGGLPLDPFFVLTLVFWVYVVVICLVLGASAVTRERERQTWDQLRITPLTGRERAMGLLRGRLGPVWVSFALVAALWWLSQPIGSGWLAPGVLPVLSRGALVPAEAFILYLSVLAGQFGLLASARSKSTTVAVVLAALVTAPFALVMAILMAAVIISSGNPFVNVLATGHARLATSLLVVLPLFMLLPVVFRDMLETRLDVG